MEGLGAEGEVSLLPRPDVWNDQETRLHEQEGSYGWTFGKLNEIHALFKYLHSVFLWTGFFEFLIYRLFLPGPENESDLNYTPQSTFRIYPKGFVPSHPGGGGVECTVQMRDRFIYFLGKPVFGKIYDFLENLQTAFDPPPSPLFWKFYCVFFPEVHDQNFCFSSAPNLQWNFLDQK